MRIAPWAAAALLLAACAPKPETAEQTAARLRAESDSARTAIAAANCVTSGYTLGQGVLNVPAMLLVLAMTALLVLGIKESAKFNNIIVFVKVTIVLLVIAFGIKYINTANWHPFIPVITSAIAM